MTTIKPRAAVQRMAPYKPPAEGRAGKLRLDFNENTVGASPRVVEAISRALNVESLTLYPEYSEARPKLARYFGVEEAEMVLTNGTDEAIQVFVNTFVEAGDVVYVPEPSYAMYRFYSEVMGARVTNELSAAKRAAMIANPNNPTGAWFEIDEVVAMLERFPQTLFLLDEAYFEFSGLTVLDKIRDYANLFVSRTFSKVHGMAALRMGCLFSSRENVAWMRKAQSPYSVNALAVIAAGAAVDDAEYARAFAAEVVEARARIERGIEELGIAFRPSRANFVLFDAGARAIEVRDKLRDAGVLVRDRSYEIPGGVRVTAGTLAQAERFLEELRRIWRPQ
ncbi:MAG: histidinol-phosphate transaminase [Bryobacteraceae bacterium]|nr:histidinol-phosphate transaminase [Bryobacteraceae bacterium]